MPRKPRLEPAHMTTEREAKVLLQTLRKIELRLHVMGYTEAALDVKMAAGTLRREAALMLIV